MLKHGVTEGIGPSRDLQSLACCDNVGFELAASPVMSVGAESSRATTTGSIDAINDNSSATALV